jgi:hypothetical protein
MIEQLVTDAARPILDFGILGAVCFFLAAALVVKERMHAKEMRDERLAHQATRDAHIEALKVAYTHGNSMREALQSFEAAMENFIELAKEMSRERGRQ